MNRAGHDGVVGLVGVATDLESSLAELAYADENRGRPDWPRRYATVGLHPHDSSDGVEPIVELARQARSQDRPSLVGIGECGLDYHYDYSPRQIQREAFARQVALAQELDLTLVVHTRSAWEDTFAILAREGWPSRTVLHCFTGGPDEARECLTNGAFISISGIVSFPTAGDIRAAVTVCPLESLVVETDSPFLAPVPFRGKPNQPARVARVGEVVAEVKGLPVGVVAEATTSNARRAFSVSA
jgi:TatD DNase family protein